MDINQFNNWAKNHITNDSKFDNDGFIITENSHNYKSTGIIGKIFEDHWDNYWDTPNNLNFEKFPFPKQKMN